MHSNDTYTICVKSAGWCSIRARYWLSYGTSVELFYGATKLRKTTRGAEMEVRVHPIPFPLSPLASS